MQNRYPLWKNILLVVLLIIGLIYGAPNLYGDDPSVQISATGTAILNTLTLEEAKKALDEHKLKYTKVEQTAENLLFRFSDTDTQLQARDVIKTALGDNYTVALNLASRTPRFLAVLGASPMKLGLDLRGGVHFLLEVDTDSLIKAREDGDVRSVGEQLREEGIRYAGIERLQPHGVLIRFRDSDNLSRAASFLKSRLPDYLIEKNEVKNEYKLHIEMTDAAVFKVIDYALDQTMNTLRNRVNELGVSEAVVQRQGANHISVDLPGIQDTARAQSIIGRVATLKFMLVDVEHDAESALAGDVPIGSK